MAASGLLLACILCVPMVQVQMLFTHPAYELFGCYLNDRLPTFFTAEEDILANNSLQRCKTFCVENSASYFAVGGGDKCRCLGTIPTSDNSRLTFSCYNENAKLCPGQSTVYCGSDDASLVYSVCMKGMHGADCATPCSCTPANALCHYQDGCSSQQCHPGYYLALSDCEFCKPHTYGVGCWNVCPTGCLGNCEKLTGKCNDCISGKKGPYCQDNCPMGRHGETCDATCSDRCKNYECEDVNGNCSSCTASDRWGPLCEQTCNNTCSPRECNLMTGQCNGGCTAHHYGDFCEKTCASNCAANICDKKNGFCRNGCEGKNTWGSLCGSPCPKNCGDGMCTQHNGTCSSCTPGWYGDTCNASCPDNCSNNTCAQDSAMCENGCEPGWKGEMCNATCAENCVECQQDGGDQCVQCADGYCGEMTCDLCTTTTQVSPTTTRLPSAGSDGQIALIAGACAGGAVLIIIIIIIIIIVTVTIRRRNTGRQQGAQDPVQTFTNPIMIDEMMPEHDEQIKAISKRDPNCTYSRMHEIPVSDAIKFALSEDGAEAIQQEYTVLPKGQQKPWDTALAVPKSKNRYKGLYAYDHSRVLLEALPDDPTSGYINANFLPTFNKKKAFIACQGPHNDETLGEFIRMLWEYKVSTVVATAKLEERGKNGRLSMKFKPYWPDGVGQDKRYGSITVKLSSEITMPDCKVRKLCLMKASQRHDVMQFHYLSWPDQNVPQVAAPLLNFHGRVRRHLRMQHLPNSHTAPPVVVHCSAGIGRTGVYIALDALLQQVSIEGVLDVQACVTRLRKDRVDMVQFPDQYAFIYNALCESIDLGITSIECGLLSHTLGTWRSQPSPSPMDKQYNLLEKMKPEVDQQHQEYALSDANKHKNRFRNIVAASEARVRLTATADAAGSDYINAVAVDGYGGQVGAFHVTQMPLEHTVEDLWRMVWENKYPALVALLATNEDGAAWCPAKEQPITLSDLQVQLHSNHAKHRNIMVLEISLSKITDAGNRDSIYQNNGAAVGGRQSVYANTMVEDSSQEHRMTMYWVVETNARSLRQTYQLLKPLFFPTSAGCRVCVMCLDGCHNCGLYVAAHNVLAMADAEHEIDVYEAVRKVRATRPQFIRDIDQYKFLYEVAEEFLSSH